MKRIYFALLGVVGLISSGGIMIKFGVGEGITLFMMLSLFIAADLFIIGGIRESIPIGSTQIKWYHLIGVGIVLIGLGIGVSSLLDVSGSSALSAQVFVRTATMLILLIIGIDFFRGGVHHDLSMVE
ncbi:hypothetical protein ACT4ML_02830 [Natrinema sp. LN54]|uniref:hypothetical protein n=1 Tax=Natrinema sp. LN54 TaxID=3458705 RepID=UPI0040374991